MPAELRRPTPTVDAHQHFWSLQDLSLEFDPTQAVLNRDYMPEDLRPQLKKLGVDHTVYVAGFPSTPEARIWELDLAERTDFIAGVTSWVDLLETKAVGPKLDEMHKHRKFVGIRHLVEQEPDPDWLAQPAVHDSLRELADRSVRYDMLVKTVHLRHVIKIIESIPQLPVVIDHIAKPDISAGGTDGWTDAMRQIATHPHVFCKLSGMITEADHTNWRAGDLKPYVEQVISWFGWDRIMFGSDWPVCRVAGEYQQVFEALNCCIGQIDQEQHGKLFGGNAINFYGLKI
jgi:L-fuconolactonase